MECPILCGGGGEAVECPDSRCPLYLAEKTSCQLLEGQAARQDAKRSNIGLAEEAMQTLPGTVALNRPVEPEVETREESPSAAPWIGEAGAAGIEQKLATIAARLTDLEARLAGGMSTTHPQGLEERLTSISTLAAAVPGEMQVHLNALAAALTTRLAALEEQLAGGAAQAEARRHEMLEDRRQAEARRQEILSRLQEADRTVAALETLRSEVEAWRRDGRDLLEGLAERRRHDQESERRARELEARELNSRGVVLFHEGAHAAAESAFRRAADLRPNYAEAHNNLGLVLSHLRRPDDAAAAFQKAVTLEPALPAALNNLGFLYHAQQRHAEAVEMFQRALEADPGLAVAYVNLGNACHRLRQHARAVDAWRKAIEIDPANQEAARALRSFDQAAPGAAMGGQP